VTEEEGISISLPHSHKSRKGMYQSPPSSRQTQGVRTIALVLVFELKVPFTVAFKIPFGVNFQPTYPFPPWTTIHGLLKAARGLSSERSDHGDWEFGLVVDEEGELIEDYVRIKKRQRGKEVKYGPTMVTRQLLYQPRYTVYMKCRHNDGGRLVEDTLEALKDPYCGFLYLGNSDSPVIIETEVIEGDDPLWIKANKRVARIIEARPERVDHVDSVIPRTAVEGCDPYDMPVRFFYTDKNVSSPREATRWHAKMRTFSMPPVGEGVDLDRPIRAYPIEGRNVVFA